jgi:FtsZ-binding cell division protein ZapB
MVSLEQVKLLESRVAKAIDYVDFLHAENTVLAKEKAGLQEKLEANQKRIDELEVLVMRFKEDQGRIEDGIIAALDRLNQFEEAFEKSLNEKKPAPKKASGRKEQEPAQTVSEGIEEPAVIQVNIPKQKEVFFEIDEKETETDDAASTADIELDIF